MELCPVVNDEKEITEIYYWEDIFDKKIKPKNQFNLPVVIMAGGIGSRLRPLTNVLPKPLIPVNEKTILEEIFDRFAEHGCDEFHVSVNYKADLIEYYIRGQNIPYNISFFNEIKPLGTAGSLSMLKDKIKQTFFVSNCDILIDQDYSDILDYHRSNKNEITIIAALKHYPIPYGTLRTGENGSLESLDEKPELTFKINSGMYILEPSVIDKIPKNKLFHITQLITEVNISSGKIGVFPVSEKSWHDLGIWQEYNKFH
jgi:NDP-sugar pyrophosphorylase family protein